MTELKPLFVSVPDTLRILGIGRTKLYDLIGTGELERVHVGTKALVSVASIERFTAKLLESA